jgi:hypothetical protein
VVQGYGINEVALAVVQTVRQQALLTLLAAPVALISANSRRFVMQGFVLAACLGLPLVIYGLMTQVDHADVRLSVAGTELLERMAWLIWFAATVVVALNQYRFRQSGKSIFFLAAAALGIGAVLSWGRLSLSPLVSATVAKPALSSWLLTPDNGNIQIRGEEGQYRATVNGETRPLEVLVALPVEVDRRVGGNGRVIRIEYFSLAGLLTIPLSESEPAFRDHPSKGQFEATDGSAYLVVNHCDGRVLRAQVTRTGNSLEVATMRFFRTKLTFPLTELDRAGISPAELASWMQTATLLKVANPVAATTPAIAAPR